MIKFVAEFPSARCGVVKFIRRKALFFSITHASWSTVQLRTFVRGSAVWLRLALAIKPWPECEQGAAVMVKP